MTPRWQFAAALFLCAVQAACAIERNPPADAAETGESIRLLGLRAATYHVTNLDSARAWYSRILGRQPALDTLSVVAFDIDGYELRLDRDTVPVAAVAGVVAFWSVTNADSALARLLELGARPRTPVRDDGNGVRTAVVEDPFGNPFGIIEDRTFRIRPRSATARR